MINEADYKRDFVKDVNRLRGGYARRYEDKFAVGLLDLMIKLPDLPPVWAEGKVIDGHAFAPTERQYVEGERMLAAGLTVLLFGWQAGILYISPWVKKADKRQCLSGVDEIKILREYLNESR